MKLEDLKVIGIKKIEDEQSDKGDNKEQSAEIKQPLNILEK